MNTRAKRLALLLCAAGLLASCARMAPPSMAGGHALSGVASWYGEDFHGRRTSNREIYNMYDMTAAHKTLPFGTRVMVTNLTNGRSVSVRINDRGPFVGERIIDLSYAAAQMIDMVGPGTASVRVDILGGAGRAAAAAPPMPRYSVQVGAFSYEDNARDLERRLKARFAEVICTSHASASRTYYRVRVNAKDRDASLRIAQLLSDDGYKVILLEE
jgi:rare lipoprotein A